jgi:hypothetical protein
VRRLGLSLVLLSAALLPTGAQAQVVVDPDSPAGKEYAIPLEQKRDQAVGGKEDSQRNPFGEGISRPGAGSSSKKGSDSSAAEGKKGRDEDDFDATGAVGGSDSGGGGGGSGSGPDEAGANGALLTTGIALAVVLLGGGIAFLMRRGAFGTDA